jgi:7-cyano-7-deazaguanine synthase
MAEEKLNDTEQPERKKVVVLASGGLDSTACIAYYLHHGYPVELLWVNYEQKAARMERLAIRRVARFYKLPLQTIQIKGLKWKADKNNPEYPGRNAIMALCGATSLFHESGLISMGIHAGTNYVDCSEAFQQQIANMIALLFHGAVAVDFPFATWSKADIAQFSVQYDAPIQLTYSCLEGTQPPCGKCESCLERQSLQNLWSEK